jgi:hypothetical protein
MDLEVFYQVIVPLLEMDSCALICISTPQDSLNFYSEMFDMKGPDGKPLFRSIQVGLACEACIRANKGDSCTHNEDEIPPWKSREKFDMVKSLYGDRKDLLMRESVGAITEDQSSLFPMHWVERVFANPCTLQPADVRHLCVAVDPNGGGSSHMAIVTSVFLRGRMVIVGLESHPVRGHDQIETLLMAHVRKLRELWGNAWIIFFAESNLGQEADHMCYMLKDMSFVHCVSEDGLSGVRTTNKRKELYAMELSKFMSQDACCICDNLCVENPFGGADARHRATEELRKQMAGFRKIVLKSTTGRSEARVCYTGKSQGANDDLIITLSICAYWGVQFYSQKVASVPYETIAVV